MEKELSQQIALLTKELEKLKFDLGDLMDSKFDGMTKNLEIRVKEMTDNYNEMSGDLKNTGKKLVTDFKTKMHEIKATVATFFAKIEVKVEKNETDTKQIGEQFN